MGWSECLEAVSYIFDIFDMFVDLYTYSRPGRVSLLFFFNGFRQAMYWARLFLSMTQKNKRQAHTNQSNATNVKLAIASLPFLSAPSASPAHNCPMFHKPSFKYVTELIPTPLLMEAISSVDMAVMPIPSACVLPSAMIAW